MMAARQLPGRFTQTAAIQAARNRTAKTAFIPGTC